LDTEPDLAQDALLGASRLPLPVGSAGVIRSEDLTLEARVVVRKATATRLYIIERGRSSWTRGRRARVAAVREGELRRRGLRGRFFGEFSLTDLEPEAGTVVRASARSSSSSSATDL